MSSSSEALRYEACVFCQANTHFTCHPHSHDDDDDERWLRRINSAAVREVRNDRKTCRAAHAHVVRRCRPRLPTRAPRFFDHQQQQHQQHRTSRIRQFPWHCAASATATQSRIPPYLSLPLPVSAVYRPSFCFKTAKHTVKPFSPFSDPIMILYFKYFNDRKWPSSRKSLRLFSLEMRPQQIG